MLVEVLEWALKLIVPVKLIVDIIKGALGEHLPPTIGDRLPTAYLLSVIIGILLGIFILPNTITFFDRILIGLITGAVPAPLLHDFLEIIREVKYNLRIMQYEK